MSTTPRHAAVLVENLYQEMELWYPVYRLREAGLAVSIVGPKADVVYTSKSGYPARSDRAAEAVAATDFDAVIIPGGYAPDHMRRHPAMVRLVAEAVAAGRVVGAICHAGWVLVSAKVLAGRTVTGFAAIADDLRNAGATYVDQPVVVDGSLVTSRVPDDLPVFMKAILERLAAG